MIWLLVGLGIIYAVWVVFVLCACKLAAEVDEKACRMLRKAQE